MVLRHKQQTQIEYKNEQAPKPWRKRKGLLWFNSRRQQKEVLSYCHVL